MRVASVCIIMALAVSTATADVNIRIASVDSSIMELTYTINATASAFGGEKREFTFPSGGFDFASGPLTVVKAFETTTGKELDWELVPAEDNQNLRAVELHYAHDIRSSGGTATTVVIRAKSDYVTKDSDGRLVIKYTTGQLATFQVPAGHRLVYTNYPVTLYERNGFVVAEALGASGSQTKELIFKIRAF